MPPETIAFFAGAIFLIAWTGIAAGLFGYVRGYATGVKEAKAAYSPPRINEAAARAAPEQRESLDN